MVSCWADISVCLDDSLTWCLFGLATCFHLNQYTAQKKDQVEWRGCGHQERAPICSDIKNMGQHWSPGRDACTQVPLVTLWMFSKFFLESVHKSTLILKGSQWGGLVFSWSQAHQLSNLMARVKWELSGRENLNIHPHLPDTWGTAVTQHIDMHCIMCSSPVPSDTRQL